MPLASSRRRYRRRTIGIRTSAQQARTIGAHDRTATGTYWYDLRTRRPFAATVKSVVDEVGAVVLFALFSPLILLIMALVRLDTPGPTVVVLRRVGFRCKPFGMYAFRTTYGVPESDEDDDGRLTAVGRVLRRFRLDNLPQLLNVLQGTMSLVGPPPLATDEVEALPAAGRRFSVLPGITGLSQVSGIALCQEERLRLDREYVNEWSLWLDVKLLLYTIVVVLRGRGGSDSR